MIHRLGVSLSESDLNHVRSLQKKFGLKNRSEFFRVLVFRYEQLENELVQLQKCIQGYSQYPETVHDVSTQKLVEQNLKHLPPEEWA